jgi:hypothetical protein
MFKDALKFAASVLAVLVFYNIILKPVLGSTVSGLVGY